MIKHAAFAHQYNSEYLHRLQYGLDYIKAMPSDWTDEQRLAQMVQLYDELYDEIDKLEQTITDLYQEE